MIRRDSQEFEDKLFAVLFVLFFIKILSLVFNLGNLTFAVFLQELGISLLVFFLLMLFARGISGLDNFSLGGKESDVLLGESVYDRLHRQYRELAEKYTEEKKYTQASYVYLKLLKDNYAAAEVLEKGGMYSEAAAIYLKYLKDKYRAAECYEKARAYNEAVKLYTETGQTEKAGDMYVLLGNPIEAKKCFMEVIDGYNSNSQYVKASLVYRNKIKDAVQAQNLLLKGWRTNCDAYNCLNNYFENVKDYEELKKEIAFFYKEETTPNNREAFLRVIKHEFKKDATLEEMTRNIAYEIVSERISHNPHISAELVYFNKNNMSISKDIIKYRQFNKRKN